MIVNPWEQGFDMNEFEAVPQAIRSISCCAINVSPKGQVTLNKKLISSIKERTDSLDLGFLRHKTDKRYIVLYVTGTPNYSFPSSGSRKDTEFTQALVENGISLPARYIVKWNDEKNVWIGVITKEKSPDALKRTVKNHRKQKNDE